MTVIPLKDKQVPSAKMKLTQEDAEFKTIDGLMLRGRAYLAEQRGPGIVLSPGVSLLLAKWPRLQYSLQPSSTVQKIC